MTQNSTSTDRENQLAALGAQLRSAREAQAYSVAEVAERLFLSSSQVNAIEQGNYERLPAEVFVKGYLRSYAKLLKLDPVQILAQYQPAVEALPEELGAEPSELPPKSLLDRFPDVPGSVVWAAMAALALLLLTTVIYFTSGTDTAEEATPALAEPGLEQQSGLDVIKPPVNAAAGIDAGEEDIAGGYGEHHLEMRFTDDCWVEVRDASRKILLADMRRAGDTEIVDGEPPYKVVLGCYEAVAVRYQGRSIPVIPDPGNKSAQMVIGG
jgi:cytoskeleton protein RodZ